MSRGTRINDDVLCYRGPDPVPVEDDEEKFSEEVFFPAQFPIGTGRVRSLNNRLLKFYSDIGYYHNCKIDAYRGSDINCSLVTKEAYDANHDINTELLESSKRSIKYACEQVMEMLLELQALGAKIYIPSELCPRYVREPPPLAPAGSLSYLCLAPHYFYPEEYPVPDGLPVENKNVYSEKKREALAASNLYLSYKYRVLARAINRIKFYRDQRIRSKLDVSATIPGNILQAAIRNCGVLLGNIIDELSKRINLGETNQLFHMPKPLRDRIMEEYAILNSYRLKDITCLYPEGGTPDRRLTYTYLLYESFMGYSLFRVNGTAIFAEPLPPSLDFDHVKSYVKLVDFYPFTTLSAQSEHCKNISEAILSEELSLFLKLNLPPWKTWNWRYRLGVRDPLLADRIQTKTQIPCVTGACVENLFRVVHEHFHSFLGIEASQLDIARLRVGNHHHSNLHHFNLEDMVIEICKSLDTMDSDISLLSQNVRKMYSLHFPELDSLVLDNCLYARLVKCIGHKSVLVNGSSAVLNDVIPQQDLVKSITDSAKSSAGHGMVQVDLDFIFLCADRLLAKLESREKIFAHLVEYMKILAPNLTALVGPNDCARLAYCAGSLTNLLHLFLEMRRDYSISSDGGIIWSSEFVSRSACPETKRKLAIHVANSCYSAFCDDYFTGTRSSARGEKLLGKMLPAVYSIKYDMEFKLQIFGRNARYR